jgi:hypothetical protein
MADGTSLINLGELSKPATVLIEKISNAVGGIFLPYQIRRVAQAEAEAAQIQALAQIEITDLERRAIRRRLAEEAIKQQNIEDIAQKALLAVKDDARPEDIENDWIANFFDKCRLISNEEMQELWARVLAGEANAPGKFSKRTVNLLASFDKSDADMFRSLCAFVWSVGGSRTPLVFDYLDSIYAGAGIDFESLRHLEAIGLISFQPGEGHNFESLTQRLPVSYHSKYFLIEFPAVEGNSVDVGDVLLTKVGQELAPVTEPVPSARFQDYVLKSWRSQGVLIRDRRGSDSAVEGVANPALMGGLEGRSDHPAGRNLILNIPWTLAIHSDAAPIAFFNSTTKLSGVTAAVKQAPIGANLVISLHTPAAELMTLMIPAGSTTVSASAAQIAAAPLIGAGIYIMIDLTSVGTIFPGSDLTVSLSC